jgi:hypothetical protein
MTAILCTRLSGVRGTLTDKLEAAPKLIKPRLSDTRRSRLALPRAIPAGGRRGFIVDPLAAEQAADPSRARQRERASCSADSFKPKGRASSQALANTTAPSAASA